MKLGRIIASALLLCTFCAAVGCKDVDAATGKMTGASNSDETPMAGSKTPPETMGGDMSGMGGGAGQPGTAGSDGPPTAGMQPSAGSMGGPDGTPEPGPGDMPEEMPANAAPMITLLSSPEVNTLTDEVVSLQADVLDDGFPGPVTVTWSVATGPGAATFAEPNAASTTVTFSVGGDYELRLTATDGELEAFVSVFVTVAAANRALDLALLTDNKDAADASNGVDDALLAYLTSLGHSVSRFNPSATPAEVGPRDAVLFSSGMDSGAVDLAWATATVPVLIWEFYALGRLAMTGDVTGGNVHDYAGGNTIEMTGTGPLAAGLSGTVAVSSTGTGTLVAPPSLPATAKIMATLGGTGMHAGRPAYFYYETGDTMFEGAVAPARRVALPLGLNQARSLTPEGQAIVQAALAWAASGDSIEVTPPEDGPIPMDALAVLPLGDSITRGTGGNNSYRQFLAEMLDAAGCAYDFVGSLRNNDRGTPTVTFDWDHEGHGGWTTGDILNAIDDIAAAQTPDIVLVHLGTNDVLQGVPPAGASANLEAIIDALREVNPNVQVIIAQIIAGSAVRMDAVTGEVNSLVTGVPPMNSAIAAVAQSKDTAASHVILVDMFSGYDDATLNFDQIHPTPSGEALMAERWFDALRPLLVCGS